MPLIGLALPVSIGVVWLIISLSNTAARFVVGLLVTAVLMGVAFLTDQRGAVWSNTETLFDNALRENPDCLPAHLNLGVYYTNRKEFDKAIDQAQQAVKLAPNGIRGRKILAYALIDKGQRREAVVALRPLAQQDVQDAEVWSILGDCFEALGDTKNAKLARESQRRCEGKL